MPCGVSVDQDGSVSPVLGAAQSMALITSLQVALEPGPSGHVFTGFPGEQGPAPSIRAVCFCCDISGLHMRFHLQKGFHCFQKCLWRPHNKGYILASPVQTINIGFEAFDVREAVLH